MANREGEALYGRGAAATRRGPSALWRNLLAALPYAYFLRVVIVMGALVALLPLALLTSWAALVRGLFDLTAGGLFWVTMLACLLGLSLLVITLLILINGGERFGAQLGPAGDEDPATRVRKAGPNPWLRLGFFLLALPIVAVGAALSTSGWPAKIAAGVLGAAGAVALSQVALLFYYLLLPPLLVESSPNGIRPLKLLGLPRLFEWAGQINLLAPIYARLAASPPRIAPSLGRGYFKYRDTASGTVDWLYPGHVMALVMSALTTAVYLGVWGLGRLGVISPAQIPALAYGLLLALMLCWLLSGVAFFFDRYRVPLTVVLVIWWTAAAWVGDTGHTYRVFPRSSTAVVTPEEVVGDRSTLIVVAANGGGIQSAAWTARVLTGLEQRARQEFGQDYRGFGRSIRFISSVSGGSVGAMYVVNAYTPEGLPAGDAALGRIVDLAKISSLNDVAAGLVYPDFVRTFLPNPLLTNDRGRALEAAWARNDPALAQGLATWREGVEAGWRPATVFNATISDTGERLLFSTAELGASLSGGQTFSRFYLNSDVAIATAARLSATFPYVTPAARAEIDAEEGPNFHVVDGGYYDNYGMSTLAEWLDRTLLLPNSPVRRVLVIQIRGAPGSADTQYGFDGAAPGAVCPSEVVPKPASGGPSGWIHQLTAPLSAMLNVRDTGQLAHNDTEFKLLQRAWRARDVEVSTAVFQYAGAEAPLSWHLTRRQADDIERHWAALLAGCYGTSGWEQVRAFLAGQ